MKVLFRADASLQIGSGHVMRCLTLARAMRQRGWQVEFASRAHSGHLFALVRDAGFLVHEFPAGTTAPGARLRHSAWLGASQKEDADRVLALGSSWDWVVVDHYGLDREWEDAVRPVAGRLFALDDIADREHRTEILLDQNYYVAAAERYSSFVSDQCRLLLGPKFSLLRDEFRVVRSALVRRYVDINRILVFFGGVDPSGETLKALNALNHPTYSAMNLSVVVGAGNPRKMEIRELLERAFKGRFRYGENISHMAKEMADADLALGAGGTTTWERCCLGLPSLVVTIAENQEQMTRDAARLGAQIYVGAAERVTVSVVREALSTAISNPQMLASMSKIAMETVDGDGIHRVLSAMKLEANE